MAVNGTRQRGTPQGGPAILRGRAQPRLHGQPGFCGWPLPGDGEAADVHRVKHLNKEAV